MHAKDLVLYVDGSGRGVNVMRTAAALAGRSQAHLTAVFVAPQTGSRLPSDSFSRRRPPLQEVFDHQREEFERTAAGLRTEFDAICRPYGLGTEFRASLEETPEQLMRHARYARLAILGGIEAGAGDLRFRKLTEEVVLSSGRPALVIPAGAPSMALGCRIVVGWNGSREATRAIADAMPFLMDAQVVELVVVLEEKSKERLHGEEPGADMARHLARYGIPLQVHQRAGQGDEAAAILCERGRVIEADLMVLGAYSHSKVREAIFGGVTRSLLAEPPRPILFSH